MTTGSVFLLVFLFGFAHCVTIQVTSFGAIPNDGIDDTAAIRSALAAVEQPNTTIFFPKGEYHMNRRLSLPNTHPQLSLVGEIPNSGSFPVVTISALKTMTDDRFFYGTKQNGTTFAWISFNGQNVTGGFNFDNSNDALVSHCDFRFIAGSSRAIYWSVGVVRAEVSDCTFFCIAPNSSWGLAISYYWGSNDGKILRNKIDYTGRGGIGVNSGAKRIVIQGNVITRTGIAAEQKLPSAFALSIELWRDCDYGVVEDNQVDTWISVDTSNYVAVRRNRVVDPGHTKPRVYSIGYENVGGCYTVWTDNYSGEGQYYGFTMTNSAQKNYTYYGYNTFEKPYSYGGVFQADGSPPVSMYFYSNVIKDVVNKENGQGDGFYSNGVINSMTFEKNVVMNTRYSLNLALGTNDYLEFYGNNFNDTQRVYWGKKPVNFVWKDNLGQDVTDVLQGFNSSIASVPKPVFTISSINTSMDGEFLTSVPITFTSTTSAIDGDVLLWDLGTGPALTGSQQIATYSKPGQYRVTLIAWNAQGRGGRLEKVIKVVASDLNSDTSNGFSLSEDGQSESIASLTNFNFLLIALTTLFSFK